MKQFSNEMLISMIVSECNYINKANNYKLNILAFINYKYYKYLKLAINELNNIVRPNINGMPYEYLTLLLKVIFITSKIIENNGCFKDDNSIKCLLKNITTFYFIYKDKRIEHPSDWISSDMRIMDMKQHYRDICDSYLKASKSAKAAEISLSTMEDMFTHTPEINYLHTPKDK